MVVNFIDDGVQMLAIIGVDSKLMVVRLPIVGVKYIHYTYNQSRTGLSQKFRSANSPKWIMAPAS